MMAHVKCCKANPDHTASASCHNTVRLPRSYARRYTASQLRRVCLPSGPSAVVEMGAWAASLAGILLQYCQKGGGGGGWGPGINWLPLLCHVDTRRWGPQAQPGRLGSFPSKDSAPLQYCHEGGEGGGGDLASMSGTVLANISEGGGEDFILAKQGGGRCGCDAVQC